MSRRNVYCDVRVRGRVVWDGLVAAESERDALGQVLRLEPDGLSERTRFADAREPLSIRAGTLVASAYLDELERVDLAAELDEIELLRASDGRYLHEDPVIVGRPLDYTPTPEQEEEELQKLREYALDFEAEKEIRRVIEAWCGPFTISDKPCPPDGAELKMNYLGQYLAAHPDELEHVDLAMIFEGLGFSGHDSHSAPDR